MEPVRELHFMMVDNKHPRLTVTPSRAVLKFTSTTDDALMERLTKFSYYIIGKLGDVTQSYRSQVDFNPAGRLYACMKTDSGKDGRQFVEPLVYEDE